MYIQHKLRCTRCVVCSSLFRKYGTGSSRTAIKLHYDEYALATAIISLDARVDFLGGLVVQSSMASGSRRLVELEQGDLLLHSYDLLHSVDVREGARRSLIMWISNNARACETATTPWKKQNAYRGNAHAQYHWARTLIFGGTRQAKGTRQSRKKGWQWMRKAAHKGHAAAQLNLGVHLLEGGHVGSARHWWLKAAKQGVSQAALNLGISFLDLDHSPLNATKGMRWLRRAAKGGEEDAAQMLGGCITYHPPCLT